MMQELSMNILDIAENSVRANASLITIRLVEDADAKLLSLSIEDNGKGMSEEMAAAVVDPFTTSRTTRKVGLGLPFLKMAAEMAGGGFSIESKLGEGTTVKASFTLGHIDLMPLGDMPGTITVLVQANPDIDFVFEYRVNAAHFTLDTRELRLVLDGVPFSEPAVAVFIKEYVAEHMAAVRAGKTPED